MQRGLQDRRLKGGVEPARIVELVEESVDVELIDGPAQQRCGGEQVVYDRVRNRSNDRLDDPGEIGVIQRLWKQLGHLGQAALTVEQGDRVDETRLERGGLAGSSERVSASARTRRSRDMPSRHAALSRPSRTICPASGSSCAGTGKPGAACTIGRAERHIVAAAGGDLDAEDGDHEHHGDQRKRESPHDRLRSRSASAGPSASSASPAATRNDVRNARVAARLS